MRHLKGILLPALLALAPFVFAKDKPIVETTPFNGELVNIFYFDDSDVAVLVEMETSKVYRSEDAGKTWEHQKDLLTLGIFKNPFDNQVAVALGENTHWITYNRGEKWAEFKTELPPSLLSVPLSFHAKDNKRILFHSIEDCFSTPCLGQVSLDSSRQVRYIADVAYRPSTPRMASSQNQRSLSKAARCACGPRALNASSLTKTSTTTGYCA
jgi:hypothetical protein